jgi:CDP-diglyceride synthetase
VKIELESTRASRLLSHHDTVSASLKRALYSPAWLVFLVVLLLLSLFSFVMFVANVSRKEAWFVALEAVLNLALVCEVGARMIAYGRCIFHANHQYCRRVLCAACVGAFVVYLVRTEDGVVFAVLLAVRYACSAFACGCTCVVAPLSRAHRAASSTSRPSFTQPLALTTSENVVAMH